MLNLNCKAVDSSNPKIKAAIATYLSSISKKRRSADQEAGFSILESLVAVAVVSILIVSIAPMVALSTSARINARRIDQATQAARSYVDAIRGGVIDTTNFPATLVKSLPNAQGQYVFEDPVAANSIQPPKTLTGTGTGATFDPTKICNNSLAANVDAGKVAGICVDAGGGGWSINDPQDLFIQPMRSGPLSSALNVSTNLKSQGFWLAVRVYRADALASGTPLRTGTEASCAGSKTPFSATASITCPIVTVRSQILPTTNANNLDDIKSGIGSKP